MVFWISIALVLNAIASFASSVTHAAEPGTLWAFFVTNYIFVLGITQAGIVFSIVMRLSRSKWGMHFVRLGEILTLCFIPFAFIGFIVIYAGGTEHIFYWANPDLLHEGVHVSPYLKKGLFLWRNIISMVLFYIASYVYFQIGRVEESGKSLNYDIKSRLRVVGGIVMVFYVIMSTFTAWDFGMTLIQHWESSVFSLYFWNGNLLAGFAFLLFISNFFIEKAPGAGIAKKYLDGYSKVLLGFVLLWTYLLWSQHIIIWYGDMPQLTEPLFRAMRGNYGLPFTIMIFTGLLIPFFGLLFKRIKLSTGPLSVITILLCIAIWINRYLMVVPVFSDGSEPLIVTWTGISLILGSISTVILSLMVFRKLFPSINTVTTIAK